MTPADLPTETTPEAFTRELEDDHRAVRERLAAVAESSDLPRLLEAVGELRRCLERHFELEERPGGLHDVVARTAPNLLPGVETVLDEHADLLTRADRLAERVRSCLEETLAAIERDKDELCQRLRDHEAEESRLLGDAFYTDLGGGD